MSSAQNFLLYGNFTQNKKKRKPKAYPFAMQNGI
jgi:hypothetical protein